jgi:hypothetical protein
MLLALLFLLPFSRLMTLSILFYSHNVIGPCALLDRRRQSNAPRLFSGKLVRSEQLIKAASEA